MYIKVKFESAKLPIGRSDYVIELHPDGKDIFFDVKKREKFVDIENIIEFSQVSNLLHVLLGARPVPSKRKAFYKRNEKIDEIVNECLVKIDTPVLYKNIKNGKEFPVVEFTQGKKSHYRSNAGNMYYSISDSNKWIEGFITWSYLYKKYYFNNKEKYNDIIKSFEEISGLTFQELKEKYTLSDFILEMHKNKKSEFEKIIKKYKLNSFISNSSSFNDANLPGMAGLTINTNPNEKIRIDGEILYKITEDMYDVIMSGNKMATFMDSGMAKVIGTKIKDEDINIEEYIQNDYKKGSELKK